VGVGVGGGGKYKFSGMVGACFKIVST